MRWIQRWAITGVVAYALGVVGWFLSRGMGNAKEPEIVWAMVVLTVGFVGGTAGILAYILLGQRREKSDSDDS